MIPGVKMIVVSNRLPFVIKRNKEGKLERTSSAGGLVTAVAPVVVNNDGFWVGWPGHEYSPSEPVPQPDPNDKTPTAGLISERVVPVNIEKSIFNSYYNGCCNETFWPLFHSMPDRAIFSSDHWEAYKKVNKLFGKETVKTLKKMENDEKIEGRAPLIWLHDYQLMLAAHTIRNFAETNNLCVNLGFFLHIPFPPWDIFRLFPWADEVLQGMLGCNMIGFHTESYCVNFIDCCHRLLGCRVDCKALLVEHGGRSVRVRPLPIGIPYDRFVNLARVAPVVLSNMKIILGVDRVDYTKGLVNRFKAFEVLLEKHPEHLGKVALLQIAVPSRMDVKEYQDLKEEIDQIVGRINGRFATPNWSPIRYIYGGVSQNELASFYRDSSVAFITPLRDGMNLVAKEYVACQINEPHGVLILSTFAGASETMHEALICNPYEIEGTAETLHRALTMPSDERALRMNCLRKREKLHDVNYWMKSFLKAMGVLVPEEGDEKLPTIMQPVSVKDFDKYLSKYVTNRHKLALLLDYDGTLSPIAAHPDLAVLPVETKTILLRLVNYPDLHVSIISGRNVENVKKMVGIENITYAGSHGLEIIHPDNSKFVYPMPQEFQEIAGNVLKQLQDQVCRDGAWVENKGVYLTFHYREAPVELKAELISKAEKIIRDSGFLVGLAHEAVEAKPPITWNKGTASIYILRTAFGLDWYDRVRIIYAGDDATDEDAMQVLKGMAMSFRVTQSAIVKTAANWRLTDTVSVLTLLKWIDSHFADRQASIEPSPKKTT